MGYVQIETDQPEIESATAATATTAAAGATAGGNREVSGKDRDGGDDYL